MFKTLLKWLADVDAYLRNSPIRTPGELIAVDDDFWESLEGRHDPIRTKIYWLVYHTGKSIKDFPRSTYYDIKHFIQRGRRGWADRDIWSLDYYLDGWMPDALRKLKKDKHGTPISAFPTEPKYIQEDGNPTAEAYKIAEANWDIILDKIIGAFEASRRLSDGIYEEELGQYPLHRPDDITREAWKKIHDDRMVASRLLDERDRKIFQEGIALFAEHYHSLWD